MTNEWRAERVSDHAERNDLGPMAAHCSLCRVTMTGADAGRSWRLSTRFGAQWGHCQVVCESCAGDMVGMCAAIELSLAVEETENPVWTP